MSVARGAADNRAVDKRVLHRIEDDLAEGWLDGFIGRGIEAVEAYLAKHAAFDAFLEDRD
jgi:hypothetical protein